MKLASLLLLTCALASCRASRPLPAPSLVVVLENGAPSIDGKPISDLELGDAFRRAAARDRRTLVVIDADRATRHGAVVQIMERARAAGLGSFSFRSHGEPLPFRADDDDGENRDPFRGYLSDAGLSSP